jgi:hypothetical protein
VKGLWRDRSYRLALAVFGLTILGLQYFGGAYQAEFDGHADEAAHLVSSLLVRDYMGQFPWPSPIPWAMDYYVHYPKVAIGHWPPGYYAVQGVWWLVFPPGRVSAMALNLLMGVSVMTLFWVLGRRLAVSGLLIGVAGVAMLSLPLMQEALSQVMAELPSLLAAVFFLWALTRVLENPGRPSLLILWLALFAAFAVKQTSVGLAAAPVVALTLGGAWRRLPRGPMLAWPAIAAGAVGLLLYWQYAGSMRQFLRWSGVLAASKMAWSLPQVGTVVGWGLIVLAAGGLVIAWQRREPVLVASVAVVVSFALCSYFVRAFREPRHWIALIPPLFLLAMAAYRTLSERTRWAPAALLLAVLLMPHQLYRQSPGGFGALAAQIHQPARMLVSSSLGWAEGPWIAIVALGERRPASAVVRATKLLATTDWNTKRYRAKVATAEDVERVLDGAGIEVVVIHDDPHDQGRLPHHGLLRATMAASAGWGRCGAAGNLAAYCRQRAPRYPRTPLRIEINRMGLGALEEAL